MELTQKVNRDTKVQSVLTELIITKDSLKPSSHVVVLKSCSHWSWQWYKYTTVRLCLGVCAECFGICHGGFYLDSLFCKCLAIRLPDLQVLMLPTSFISPSCSDSQVCQCHSICPTLWFLSFSGCGWYLHILISSCLGHDPYGQRMSHCFMVKMHLAEARGEGYRAFGDLWSASQAADEKFS